MAVLVQALEVKQTARKGGNEDLTGMVWVVPVARRPAMIARRAVMRGRVHEHDIRNGDRVGAD